MSPRRISAVVCAALALTFASGSAALAYSADSAGHTSTTDDSCTVRGTNGDDNGMNGRPVLVGTPDADVICGLGGNDRIFGGPGSDTIHGGDGDDYIEGQGGDDTIYGGGGNDTLFGQTGNDTIDGGTGTDTINGGNGRDKIDGGADPDDCGPVDPNDVYRINCP
jgi:Ca2+-binding RTX toxin-like protein